jgi:predicted CopG family antitoxin
VSRTITVSDDVYSQLHEISKEREISFDALIKELITDLPHQKKQTSWYQSFKQEMLKKHPELAEWTKEQFVFEFERLSRKAAEGLPFETLEEMECFMRREKFDPRRY